MVVFYLRNSRNPDGKIVPITVALTADAIKAFPFDTRPDQNPLGSGIPFPNMADPEGDQHWIVVLETTELDSSGNPIDPEIINVVTTGTLHQEIEAGMGRIADQIDWGSLQDDTRPPVLAEFEPEISNTTNVPITSNIVARLQEKLPAAGIDFDTVRVKVNDFDVTNDVEFRGTPFDLKLIYRPKRILS
jgi:hypothetical protein